MRTSISYHEKFSHVSKITLQKYVTKLSVFLLMTTQEMTIQEIFEYITGSTKLQHAFEITIISFLQLKKI